MERDHEMVLICHWRLGRLKLDTDFYLAYFLIDILHYATQHTKALFFPFLSSCAFFCEIPVEEWTSFDCSRTRFNQPQCKWCSSESRRRILWAWRVSCVFVKDESRNSACCTEWGFLLCAGIMGEYEPKIEVQFPEVTPVAKGQTVKLECFALGKYVTNLFNIFRLFCTYRESRI